MSVVTLSDVKRYLRITSVDPVLNAELQATIDSAEATIAGRVGPLSPTTVSGRLSGGAEALILDVTPVISLTTVTPAGGSPLTVGDLLVDSDTGIVKYASGAGSFPASVYAVTYLAGWQMLPADLVTAVKELVRHRWRPQRGSVRPRTAADAEDTEKVAEGEMPSSVEQVLDSYESDEQGFA